MSNYYEETMPIEINKDEYLKYYFDESLPLFDRLNTIIKRGQPFQKQALLSKLKIYQSHSLFKSLMQYIINDIETWDKETISLFPKCLHNLLTQSSSIILSSIDNELFNMILKHIIVLITSTDERISEQYIYYFEQIVFFYSDDKHSFPYSIKDELYENIISLGKFGQTIENRKLSCYLCCAICRIIKNVKDKNLQKLYDRICFLFCDNEKQIEMQLSKDLEYLIPIFKKDLFLNNDILQAIYSYINHDSDHIIQTTTILSIIKNIHIIDNIELAKKIFYKIKEILEEVNYEQHYKNEIFCEIIFSLFNNYKLININIIKILFNENIIPNFINTNKKEKIIIENFDKIFFIFNDMNRMLEIWRTDNNNINDFNNFNFEDLFCSIFYIYFNPNNIYNQRKNCCYSENEIYSNKKIFYNNIMKIITCLYIFPNLSNLKNIKSIYEKINYLFMKENIVFALKCYSENIKIKDKKRQKKIENNTLYILMKFLLKKYNEGFLKSNLTPTPQRYLSPIKKEPNNSSNNNNLYNINNENFFIKLFHHILNNILSSFKECKHLFNNNIHLLLCDLFQRIIKKIYKYLKPTTFNVTNQSASNIHNNRNNNIKIRVTDKIYEDIFNYYLIELVENDKVGNYIKNEVIQVFPYLILYSKNRTIYLNFIKEKIIYSTGYFSRRYAIFFLDKCLQIYSFNMFIKIGLLDILLSLANDINNSISANIINLIYIYNKKIMISSGLLFQNICKNLSKINKINKENKSINIQNFDIEKNRNIKKILDLNLSKNYSKNMKASKEKKDNENNIVDDKDNDDYFWEINENKLIMRENEIFGKDPNYGFNDIKSQIKRLSSIKHSQSPDIHSFKRKNSYANNTIKMKDVITLKTKDKLQKRLTRDRQSSSVIINNINSNFNTKIFLPKINQNRNSIISNSKNIQKFNINLNFKIKQENPKLEEIK